MNYETTVRAEQAEAISSDSDDAVTQQPRRGFSLWLIILGILFLAGVIGLAYLSFSGGPAPAADDEEEGASQLPAITVISPGQETVEGEITATGTIAARREVPVGVVGEGGRVQAVPVDAGDWVKQGQVLVVIDRSVQQQQAVALSAQIEVAQADANLAQANLDRALKLVDRGFISKADVDRLTATRDAASARVKVARAQLNETRARNARLNIYAPTSGLVLERNVEPGQTVGGGSPPLFRIAKNGEMEVMAQVSEEQLAKLPKGVSAEITPTGSDAVYKGQVWQISPVINEQSRQGIARIALPYADGLRPGGFATAVIKSGTAVATVLPESAVLSDEKGSYVYIIDGENKAQRRDVETGPVTANGITILTGIDGSEKIALRAGGFLTEGETVRPVRQEPPANAPAPAAAEPAPKDADEPDAATAETES
jgi:RND family efflux transporter MFP subunit